MVAVAVSQRTTYAKKSGLVRQEYEKKNTIRICVSSLMNLKMLFNISNKKINLLCQRWHWLSILFKFKSIKKYISLITEQQRHGSGNNHGSSSAEKGEYVGNDTKRSAKYHLDTLFRSFTFQTCLLPETTTTMMVMAKSERDTEHATSHHAWSLRTHTEQLCTRLVLQSRNQYRLPIAQEKLIELSRKCKTYSIFYSIAMVITSYKEGHISCAWAITSNNSFALLFRNV